MQASSSHISLSDLNEQIRRALAGAFNNLLFWVVADVTSHSFRPGKNYHYFDLVEKDTRSSDIIAKISANAWGSGSTKIAAFEHITGQRFTSGIHILLNVTVDYHPVYGLRLNLIDIDPNFTLGALALQKQLTLDRLVAENPSFIKRVGDDFVTSNNRLVFRHVIQRVALITSRTSAGGEDFKHTLENNTFGYQFFIDEYFAGVQGEANADLLLSQIIAVFNSGIDYDAVAIIRGGGAQTDFLIFDNYYIGKAIAKFPVPVITGIGHQKDSTIADLMAHTAAKTPTKAAELIIAHNRSFEEAALRFQQTIIIRTQQQIAAHKDALVQLHQSVINETRSVLFNKTAQFNNTAANLVAQPRVMIYNRQSDLRHIIVNLKINSRMYLKLKTGYLGHQHSIIKLMSPENILKKGFAVIKQNGKIISHAAGIEPGSGIAIILSDKELRASITDKKDYDGRDFKL